METQILNPNVMERSFQRLLNYFAWALRSGKLIVKNSENATTLDNHSISDIMSLVKNDTNIKVSEPDQYLVQDLDNLDLSTIKIIDLYIKDYGEIDTSSIEYQLIDGIRRIKIPSDIMTEFRLYPIIITWIEIKEVV